MALIQVPDFVFTAINTAMSDILSPDNLGDTCILYYPPIESGCVNCLADPIGKKSGNIYVNGGPMPFNVGQICPMCNGLYYLAIEHSENVNMSVNWEPSKFDPSFPAGYRYADGMIMTRGFSSDLQKILNADFMEIHTNVGFSHYRYKLIGEPVFSAQTSRNFFWAWWDRA